MMFGNVVFKYFEKFQKLEFYNQFIVEGKQVIKADSACVLNCRSLNIF